MKKILIGLAALFIPATVFAAAVFNSSQVGNTPTNGYVLQTNGSISTWVATSTLGITGTGGSSFAYPFIPSTNFSVTNQATTGIAWFQNGLNASSTSHFVYASSTELSASIIQAAPGKDLTLDNGNKGTALNQILLSDAGQFFYTGSDGQYNYGNGLASPSYGSLDFSLVASGQTYTFPNSTGTICLTTTCAGTVTSVGISTPNSTLSLGGTNPVTTNGTISADLNLSHSNTWTASTTFANGLNVNIATTSKLAITSLASASGAFLAINPLGQVISTSTPTGASGITTIGPAGQGQTGATQTFATSTSATNGLTSAVQIVGSSNTQTFTPSISGTLTTAGGGTGLSNPGSLSASAILTFAGSSGATAIQPSYIGQVLGSSDGSNWGNASIVSGGSSNNSSLTLRSTSSGTASGDYIAFQTAVQVERARILSNGNFGIATTSPWRTLSVSGTVAINGLSAFATGDSAVCIRANGEITFDSGVSSCIVSSKYVKHNILGINASDSETRIMALNPVSFAYNESDQKDIGLIAEDAASIDPRYAQYTGETKIISGHTFKPGDVTAVNWSAITADLVKTVQIDHLALVTNRVKRTAEENWQWIVMSILAAGFIYQQWQIKKLRK